MEKLETKDYKLVKVYDKKYVFLTGSQDVLEIQNPLLPKIRKQSQWQSQLQ